MKRFKIDFLACYENIPIDMIQWQYSSSKNVILLHSMLFRSTLDKTHVECSFVKLFNNHLIYFLFHIKVIFLSCVVNEEQNPFL